MKVEEVAKNKNTITIIAFALVCIALNLENISLLFHLHLPYSVIKYSHYFPLLFVIVVFTQKKSCRMEVSDETLWEVKRKEALFINNTKSALRYLTVSGISFIFLFSNMYKTGHSFDSRNGIILMSLIIMIAITFIYNYFKKGFQVGFCSMGILYGYTTKVMLIKWKDIADFELDDTSNIVTIHCKRKMSLNKIVLSNKDHYEALKTLVTNKLTYKNVAKLLTDD